MSIDLTDRRALVTGAGHGIGRAIAERLAQAGADVVVHYGTSADAAEQTAAAVSATGRKAWTVQADVTDPAAVKAMVDEAVDHLGGLDVLVTNAGHLVQRCPVVDMETELWHRIIDVNATSTFLTCRAAIAALRASGGRIVTMSSLAAHNGGGPGSVAYAAAKAAVSGFTRGLAKELAPDGVAVNAVAPGFIGGTAFHDTFTPEQAQAAIVNGIPLGRPGTADDVADAVLWLASPLAGFVTGETVDVNGGQWPR